MVLTQKPIFPLEGLRDSEVSTLPLQPLCDGMIPPSVIPPPLAELGSTTPPPLSSNITTDSPPSPVTLDDGFGGPSTIPPAGLLPPPAAPAPPRFDFGNPSTTPPIAGITPPLESGLPRPRTQTPPPHFDGGLGDGTPIPPNGGLGDGTTIPPNGGITLPPTFDTGLGGGTTISPIVVPSTGDLTSKISKLPPAASIPQSTFTAPPDVMPPPTDVTFDDGFGGPSTIPQPQPPPPPPPAGGDGLGSGTTIPPDVLPPAKELATSQPPPPAQPVEDIAGSDGTGDGSTVPAQSASSTQESLATEPSALVTLDDGFGGPSTSPFPGSPLPGGPTTGVWTGTTIPPQGVPVPDAFKQVAFMLVGQKGADTTIQVGTQTTGQKTISKSISDLNRPKEETWSFVANTIAANVTALAALSRFLEAEVATMNHPKWATNSKELTGKLNAAVTATDQLCKDVVTTLSAPKPS